MMIRTEFKILEVADGAESTEAVLEAGTAIKQHLCPRRANPNVHVDSEFIASDCSISI
jgi:hypothetical protein